jgi:hypothetical protein
MVARAIPLLVDRMGKHRCCKDALTVVQTDEAAAVVALSGGGHFLSKNESKSISDSTFKILLVFLILADHRLIS